MSIMTTFSLLIALAGCNDAGVTAFNASPEAAITSHTDGAEVFEGMTVTFRGSASDPDDTTATLTTTWYLGTAEACPATLADATGVTSCDIAIGIDDTEVTLEVTDPGAASGSASITLTVVPTDSPDAEIVTPEASGVYYSDQKITFEGVVSDGEDASEDLTAYWESDIDGLLKDVEAVPNAEGEVLDSGYLTEGEHFLVLSAEDTTGKTGADSVTITVGPPNSGPTCSITAPDDNSAGPEGELVIFEGLVDDVDVPADWLSVAWSSDKDGDLGESAPDSEGKVAFPYSDLSVETHVVTMTTTDEIGATCTSFIIYTVGEPPEVEITLPTDGSVLQQGDAVTFTATVSDNEDLPNEVALVWSSDVDGVLSKAGSDSSGSAIHVTSGLSAGPHLVTLLGTDTDGLFSTDTVYITVNQPPVIDSIDITPATGVTTTTTLTCTATGTDPEDGALTPDYTWDNVSTAAPLGSGSGLSLTAADASPGDEIACTATITDSDGAIASASTSVFVENSAPSISSVTINPNPATASDALTCSWSGFSDADGDSDASTINWQVNGVDSGTSTVLMSGFVGGDTVTCTVTAFDGTDVGTVLSDTIVIDNTAPVLADVLLEPTPAYEDTTLTCTPGSATDSDGAAITFNYAWTVNSVGIAATSTTLTGADFDKNDDVFCTVTPTDGSDSGAAIDSGTVTIQNTAPEAPFISIIPAAPIAGEDDLVCSVDVDSYDLDGDSISYDYEWAVDGAYYSTGSTVPGTDTTAGETWTCTVTPNDGDEDGASSSTSVVIEEPAVEECWSLDFDGFDDAVVVDDNPEWAFGTDDFSITTWVKFQDIGGHAGVLQHYEDDSNKWQLFLLAGNIHFSVKEGGIWTASSVLAAWTPDLNTWYNIVTTRESGTFKFYIDGTLIGSITHFVDVPDFSGTLRIGESFDVGTGDEYLNGTISSIHIWNRALSDTEINTYLYSDPTGSEADLLSLWSMNEGSGITAGDSSGGSNDGTIDGATWVNDCPEPVEPTGLGSTEDNPGIDCLDILESGDSTGDGTYWIDPLETGAYEVYCVMDATYDGGGWTLAAVSSDDGQDTWTWNNRHYWDTDTTTFGDLGALNEDFKSPSLHEVGAADLLFVHQPSGEWAAYNDVNLFNDDMGSFIGTVGGPNCFDTGTGYPMTFGSIGADGNLCETDLYISAKDHDGSATCSEENDAYGPSWNISNNNGCPFDDPGDWGALGPNNRYITAPVEHGYSAAVEYGHPTSLGLGFGWALDLNTGTSSAAENYMWVLVRRGEEEPAPETDYTSPSTGYGMKYIPPGTFDMGCTTEQAYDGRCEADEFPVHSINLTHGFWMGETELTQNQWQTIIGNNPSEHDCTDTNCPVDNTNHWDAMVFANTTSVADGFTECYTLIGCTGSVGVDLDCSSAELNSVSGSPYDCDGYRLPTEAEWEYAARAGTDLLYAGGNTATDIAWHNANAGGQSHEVASLAPNEWGLYDMSGNLWEITQDWYVSDYYSTSPSTDPSGPNVGTQHVKRGGCQGNSDSELRVANRHVYNDPSFHDMNTGFRLVRTVP